MYYSKTLLRYFFKRKHAGQLPPGPNVVCHEEGSESQGFQIKTYLQIENKVVVKARFEVYGSPALIASMEYACEYVEGKSVLELVSLKPELLMSFLEMPGTLKHVALLVVKVFRESIGPFDNSTRLVINP